MSLRKNDDVDRSVAPKPSVKESSVEVMSDYGRELEFGASVEPLAERGLFSEIQGDTKELEPDKEPRLFITRYEREPRQGGPPGGTPQAML